MKQTVSRIIKLDRPVVIENCIEHGRVSVKVYFILKGWIGINKNTKFGKSSKKEMKLRIIDTLSRQYASLKERISSCVFALASFPSLDKGFC